VIRALRRPNTDTLRRGLGILLVVAFVVLLVVGAAHAMEADHDHAESHECGVCVALAVLSAALPTFLIVLLWRARVLRSLTTTWRPVAIRRRARGPPPVRGPPVCL